MGEPPLARTRALLAHALPWCRSPEGIVHLAPTSPRKEVVGNSLEYNNERVLGYLVSVDLISLGFILGCG